MFTLLLSAYVNRSVSQVFLEGISHFLNRENERISDFMDNYNKRPQIHLVETMGKKLYYHASYSRSMSIRATNVRISSI